MRTLNTKEAADFLKIHPVTMMQLARSNEVRGAKVGRSWVFFEVDLVNYLNQLMNTGAIDKTMVRKKGRPYSRPPLSETLPKFCS